MSAAWRDLQVYKLQVTHLEPDGDTGTTTHDSGGTGTADQTGTWERQRRLGSGSSGTVFLEQKTATETMRAVKILMRGTESDKAREIRNTLFARDYKRLFVGFYAWYEHGDVRYISMEYLAGGNLRSYIDKVGAISESEARGIAEQILQAVFVLHEQNSWHRDIKPENILLVSTNPFRIKVADFGQTKQVDDTSPYHSTTGTRAWGPPEQRSGIYDKTVDLWAVGCVVYYLLTSLYPFIVENHRPPVAPTKKYTYPFWPCMNSDKFQEHPTRRVPGDQIIVKGASTAANDFLNRLIVRVPERRMLAHEALCHKWIGDTSPLESALRCGDLPLSRLLARVDPRYHRVWQDPLPKDVSQVILRVAAAHGHQDLVALAMGALPPKYELSIQLTGWVNAEPALVGAAMSGNLQIVKFLLRSTRLSPVEKSVPILVRAFKASLRARHHQIASVLLALLPLRSYGDTPLSNLIAAYADLTLLCGVIQLYEQNLESRQYGAAHKHGPRRSLYAKNFPTMLQAAAQGGNIQNLKHLLSNPPSQSATPEKHLQPELAFSRLSIPPQVLLRAVSIGHRDIANLLLDRYPRQIRSSTILLRRALHMAARHGQLVLAVDLLDRGALPGRDAIQAASTGNHNAVVQALLQALVLDGSPDSLDMARDTATSLIPYCDLSLLRWLRTPSASPDSDIRKAAIFGDLTVVKYLLHQTPPYTPPAALLRAALVGAAEAGHVNIIKYLYTHEIKIESTDAWIAAAKKGHVGVAEQLLCCENPDKQVLSNPLKLAAQGGHLGVVMVLLGAGAVWIGSCEPVIMGVLTAFAHGGALPEIGAAGAARR